MLHSDIREHVHIRDSSLFGRIFDMWKKIVRFIWKITVLAGILGVLGLFLPRLITTLHAWNKIYTTAEEAPAAPTAIIFGAGLRRDGTPTAVLRDRVESGAALYFSGKAGKLLMSGTSQGENYNEPQAMRLYALSLGVPDEAIVLDYAGSRTYDTCYRAKAVFGVENALLVTQRFHLPRALFLCNAMGVQAAGVEANNLNYRRSSLLFWNIREQFATFTAFMDVFVEKPTPVLGQAQPIFMD